MRKNTKEREIAVITAMSLRGGMQERLHRQEVIRYSDAVKKHKKMTKKKEKKKHNRLGIQSFRHEVSESIEDFSEPVFRNIRSKWGFFAYE